jgi:hypothetical protein
MKSWGPPNLRVFRDFRLLMGLRGSCGAQAKGRGRRGDFSMVRIRLARFALPRLGLSGSKSGRIMGQELGELGSVTASSTIAATGSKSPPKCFSRHAFRFASKVTLLRGFCRAFCARIGWRSGGNEGFLVQLTTID